MLFLRRYEYQPSSHMTHNYTTINTVQVRSATLVYLLDALFTLYGLVLFSGDDPFGALQNTCRDIVRAACVSRCSVSWTLSFQMILNFLVLIDSPTFYWIHAAKPTPNAESLVSCCLRALTTEHDSQDCYGYCPEIGQWQATRALSSF